MWRIVVTLEDEVGTISTVSSDPSSPRWKLPTTVVPSGTTRVTVASNATHCSGGEIKSPRSAACLVTYRSAPDTTRPTAQTTDTLRRIRRMIMALGSKARLTQTPQPPAEVHTSQSSLPQTATSSRNQQIN